MGAVLLEMVDLNDPIEVGNTETYVITLTNQGSAIDNNLKVICTMEEQMEFVSAAGPTEGKAEGKIITFQPLPALAPKAKAVWRVVIKAAAPADVRFKVEATSDQLKRPVEKIESTTFYK